MRLILKIQIPQNSYCCTSGGCLSKEVFLCVVCLFDFKEKAHRASREQEENKKREGIGGI